jgi:hypothetical protein
MTNLVSFARRRNPDSSVDSICATCYQTIASSESDLTLSNAEESHRCDPNAELDRTEALSHQHHGSGGVR